LYASSSARAGQGAQSLEKFKKIAVSVDIPAILCYNLRTVLKLKQKKGKGMTKQYYHTRGREALIAYLREHPDCQFCAEELCQAINEQTSTGKSTVYRHLTQLCREDAVRRFRSEERGCNVYQYVGEGCDCRLHFHEKCLRCGRIEHLDCHGSSEFAAHLRAEHGFVVDCGQSILYGLCAECYAKAEGGNAHA
jgi:Fur family ferric uptake transcriptional regulator